MKYSKIWWIPCWSWSYWNQRTWSLSVALCLLLWYYLVTAELKDTLRPRIRASISRPYSSRLNIDSTFSALGHDRTFSFFFFSFFSAIVNGNAAHRTWELGWYKLVNDHVIGVICYIILKYVSLESTCIEAYTWWWYLMKPYRGCVDRRQERN
jgi:hypothetical protein